MDITKLKRGMNIDLKPWTDERKAEVRRYMDILKKAGFDHVRLPFTVNPDNPACRPETSFYKEMRDITQMALDSGFYVMVDIHPFAGMNENPLGNKNAFLKFWSELADYMKDMDERVIFEVMNEPDNKYDYVLLNEIQNEAIKEIRKSNPTRWIAAASAHCNTIENLMHLELPADDKNIFVTLHEYTPMKFTHQGADWMSGDWPTGVVWGSDKERRLLEYRFDMAKRWSDFYGRYVHLGEFGVMCVADLNMRAEWTAFMVKLCEERGFGWAYWEFCYGFRCYDIKTDKWIKPVLDALIYKQTYNISAVLNNISEGVVL